MGERLARSRATILWRTSPATLLEIRAEIEPGDATHVGFRHPRPQGAMHHVQNSRGYRHALGPQPWHLRHGRIKLHVLVDRTSVEVFGNEGQGCR